MYQSAMFCIPHNSLHCGGGGGGGRSRGKGLLLLGRNSTPHLIVTRSDIEK